MVPGRRPPAHPAWHLDRPQAHRRLAPLGRRPVGPPAHYSVCVSKFETRRRIRSPKPKGPPSLSVRLQLAVEPVEDELGPLDAVHGRARTGELVALPGEPVELHLPPEEAQRHEELL